MSTHNEIMLDVQRPERLNFDEAVLCEGKSARQLNAILQTLYDQQLSMLMTRLHAHVLEDIAAQWLSLLDYDSVSATAFFNGKRPTIQGSAQVAVVAAGTSDTPVATEAMRTLDYLGVSSTPFIDIGVAGLWRLTSQLDVLQKYPVVIAVAGMDGALPSVLGGLLPGVLIVTPTSTGYGASRGGETALHAALASCAPGLTVVNIDNGYGAACAAFRVVNMINVSRKS